MEASDKQIKKYAKEQEAKKEEPKGEGAPPLPEVKLLCLDDEDFSKYIEMLTDIKEKYKIPHEFEIDVNNGNIYFRRNKLPSDIRAEAEKKRQEADQIRAKAEQMRKDAVEKANQARINADLEKSRRTMGMMQDPDNVIRDTIGGRRDYRRGRSK